MKANFDQPKNFGK